MAKLLLSKIYTLASLRAPHSAFGTRGLPRGTEVQDKAFWDGYDNNTLIYDCVWMPTQGCVRLVMPKLLDFKKTLLSADIKVDDTSIQYRLSENLKFDTLDLPCDAIGSTLSIQIEKERLTLPVNPANYSRYDGCNVLYTQIKNDDLNWVYDWGLAHQRNHGVDAILIADNGSTAYSSEDLRRTLARIPGLKVADVLTAPHSHGAHHTTCTGAGSTKFLQPALLNLARDRFLAKARAVLLCDVDELVHEPNNRSIFDAVVASPLKYKSFNGVWRYAQSSKGQIHHSDHIFARDSDRKCPTKYCIVPDSRLGRMTWGVHSLEKINRHIFKPFNSFQFYHCKQISTSWKSNRNAPLAADGLIDQDTQNFMNSTFQPEA